MATTAVASDDDDFDPLDPEQLNRRIPRGGQYAPHVETEADADQLPPRRRLRGGGNPPDPTAGAIPRTPEELVRNIPRR